MIFHSTTTKVPKTLKIMTFLTLLKELLPLHNLLVVSPVGLRATNKQVIVHSFRSALFFHCNPDGFSYDVRQECGSLVASVSASCGPGQDFNLEGLKGVISGVAFNYVIEHHFCDALAKSFANPDEVIANMFGGQQKIPAGNYDC